MTNSDFLEGIQKVKENLPVNYQFINRYELDKNEVIRTQEMPFYNSKMSICKAFHRPISKLYDKEGRI